MYIIYHFVNVINVCVCMHHNYYERRLAERGCQNIFCKKIRSKYYYNLPVKIRMPKSLLCVFVGFPKTRQFCIRILHFKKKLIIACSCCIHYTREQGKTNQQQVTMLQPVQFLLPFYQTANMERMLSLKESYSDAEKFAEMDL